MSVVDDSARVISSVSVDPPLCQPSCSGLLNRSFDEPQDTSLDFEQRFKELRTLRAEARKLNQLEVVEEDRRRKLPKNWEAVVKRAEWELQDMEAKKAATAEGMDYEQLKRLETSARDAERAERSRKKKNPDQGFTDFASAQFRQYERLVGQIKPDIEKYEADKERLGQDVFPTANNISGFDHKPSEEAAERMVNDLKKQLEKRSKYHRRRQFFEEADIDYINEKNRRFNMNAERFYGKYTKETKDNLERGTAL